MCGIAGLIGTRETPSGDLIGKMTDCIRHRGPDGEGTWHSPDGRVALGHRRLAIQDLSPLGRQPMTSADGRFILVFNGEVYNFLELQQELRALGHAFRGHSDTEVMLTAFTQWGVTDALSRFTGMFAFAVWDRTDHSVTLVRDRFGVKPLYYGMVNGIFAFASELSSFAVIPGFTREIDRSVLPLYLRYGNVPAPHCIWRDLHKLPPGTSLRVELGGVREPVPFWSLLDAAARGHAAPFRGDYQEALERTDALLRQSIRWRLISDVPVGVFLSGGVDSSLVAALAQSTTGAPVSTYTIGFDHETYDESKHAAAVAAHLGTRHTTLMTDEARALAVVARLPRIYDEPFADSSQIPTFLVAEMARRHVTVALSGDGGDEIFGGYNRHLAAPGLWRKASRVPRPLRHAMAWTADRNLWASAAQWANRSLPAHRRVAAPLEKLQKLAVVLQASDPRHLHLQLSSLWRDPASAVVGPVASPTDAQPAWPDFLGYAEFMMLADALQYMPDDILVKVDRASMAVALEVREPLLDHHLVEFAWSLPLEFKIQQTRGKRLLRDVLYRHVPRGLIDRPKSGFGLPIDDWLRGALRDWAETLLAPGRLKADGFFRPEIVSQLWREHLANRRNHHHRIWTILMFNAWLDEWRER